MDRCLRQKNRSLAVRGIALVEDSGKVIRGSALTLKRLAAVWVDLVLLGVYGVLFFAGAYVAFLRYDLR